MCGIHGDFAYASAAPSPDVNVAHRVRDAMASRGPDGAGIRVTPCGRVVLSHRRLSILDPTTASSQPMVSTDGRFTLVFNGEIYNFRDVRDDLEGLGVEFRTTGDSEVLLQAYAVWKEKCVERLIGMFAFAVWDERDRSLFLARDHHGIKPLYVSDHAGHFRFASSVRALLEDPATSREVDQASVVAFLAWGSVPEPRTLFKRIRSLPAGHYVRVTQDGVQQPIRYWHVAALLQQTAGAFTDHEINSLVRAECRATAQRHLVADVPVGLFLSAGVDSTALLGLTTEVGCEPLRTITLAFQEFAGTAADEAVQAERSAALNNAEHTTVRLEYREVEALLAQFLTAMDQPTNDGLNTFLVSRTAHRAGLKAAMSGVGADELFGGYPSFRRYPALRRLAAALDVVPGATIIEHVSKYLPESPRKAKLEYAVTALKDPAATYHLLRGVFVPSEIEAMLTAEAWRTGQAEDAILSPVRDAWTFRPPTAWGEIWAAEHSVYLRGQLLRDSDWASMAHSLELRTPFVDRRLTERLAPLFVARHERVGKAALAQAPQPPLNESLRRRPKTGFGLPMRDWTLRALDRGVLRAPPETLFRADVGARAIERLRAGRVHWSRAWGLFALGAYLDSTRAV